MTAAGVGALVRANAARHGALAAALGTAVLALSVMGLALSQRGIELAPGLPAWLAVAGFVGLVAMVVAAWVVHTEHPGVATGLSLGMVGLAVPSWAAWDWVPLAMVPILHAMGPLAVAGAAHVGLASVFRGDRRRALTAVYTLIGLGVVLMAIGYDPLADPGCVFTCADADPAAASLVTTRAAVTATALLVVAGAAVAGWSLVEERRAPRPLRLYAGAGLGLLVADWALHAVRWTDPVPGVAQVAPRVAAAVILAAGVLASWWRMRRTRIAAEQLVAALDDTTASGGTLREMRAVEFAIPGEDRWVDSDGRPVRGRAPSNDAVVLRERGEPAVRVWLAPGAPAPALDALSQSARVALANARLEAVTRARLEEVRESRRRIVGASDAERLRIERDLHDGAQQRLISASLHISAAASRLPASTVERAQTAIVEALEQLRGLAHRLVPDSLHSHGLRAALEDLVQAADVPASLAMKEDAVDPDAAIAVHAVVLAVLAHASDVRAREARVEVTRPFADRLHVRIEVWAPSGLDAWDELPIADRIGAVGGTTTVDASPTRLLLRAELPCVS
ncbi:MAG TPA: histidine kinase [Candidatus Limnocylindria bacterium]